MFDKLKKAFSREVAPAPTVIASPPVGLRADVAKWAAGQGLRVSDRPGGKSLVLEGKAAGRQWVMELGEPTRKYVRTEELRARAELGINDSVAAMVMTRKLKEALEKQAYQMFTDTLQTTADPNLPEEMRWLSMYEELGWESLPMEFWDRYAVLSDERDHAMTWVTPELAKLLMHWPDPAPSAEIPLILLVMRGKCYLRMEMSPQQLGTVQHAVRIYTAACESAVEGLSTDLAL